jgi:hypothetical protein
MSTIEELASFMSREHEAGNAVQHDSGKAAT